MVIKISTTLGSEKAKISDDGRENQRKGKDLI
jgi:hypothetical protein